MPMVHFLNSFSFKIFLIYQYHDFSVDFKLRVHFSVLTIWPLPSSFLCGNFGHVSFCSLCVKINSIIPNISFFRVFQVQIDISDSV